jgi:hypothetical protein
MSPLWTPPHGYTALEDNQGAASTEIGLFITSDPTTAHTKGPWNELIASTGFDAYGVTVALSGLAIANTNTRCLVDIGVGASTSEAVIINNLLAGGAPSFGGTNAPGLALFYFPIFIPAATRIAARSQSLIIGDGVGVCVWLHQKPLRPGWFGTRVTSYGPDTATSSGVSHSPGNASYAAATEIVASTTNPIRALQVGIDLLTDTTATNASGLLRIGIGSTPIYIAADLPYSESTTAELTSCVYANMILSQQRFNLAAATRLVISAQRNVAAEARGFALYGVD